jgi:hypothetical protein
MEVILKVILRDTKIPNDAECRITAQSTVADSACL